jgi:2-hydroxycyclohexanecarboxyl-CoA dehydrogenase
MTELPLAGRTALVTGAAAGIGAAISGELAGLGAAVLLADLDAGAAGKLAAELPAARVLEVDLDDPAAVDRCADAAGPVDILVSNAGITVVERFSDSDPVGWDRMWRINLRAPLQLAHRLLPGMMERGFGRLVFISSDSARVGAGGEVIYSATKAGLHAAAKSLAREAARRGVTCNVVCPGLIDTSMLRGVARDNPGVVDRLLGGIPQRRFGTPDEVASLACYLCSARAAYVTGQVMSVSGGVTMA